ncbi:hypothetical protein [Nostoc sp. 'Lobaria pulmonaria (5183) cyanobiont']|uniref:nSTAND3 domain-containing NTPase n=1 Tax=Nostoc sp. 'Lobaria pulmonaria (5183) cyanobiont' TaxID=1618022 RepID=UPI000CF30B10|nr:hypothetical protein [Nostoc sp. 'Lobaria pulmonaria (5183) cyanobiont']AVH72578.1 DNA replication ATPase [Nostoc sp. 'Lobaria pulmonaria (5183) cyanobiont']
MSKINQIQNELRQQSGEKFQKLADAYLHKKGYERINPIGSVIGADKVRTGTPDTLVILPNGKYVFAEYTTEKKGVAQKFKKDLDKCFDEVKTGISVEKIQEIVLCHTSMLSPDEEVLLREECQNRGVNLNIFGLGPISYDLYQKYPGIARDFLGVEVDTGQIVDLDEFIKAYDKKAATPLNTTFHFREEELKQVLQGLNNSNLVIVSGKAGIGKSRLALESCNQFLASHPEYQVRCIFLRGANIFEDLRVYFSEPGCHLIFVDDANRVNSFEYFIQILHDQREDQQIKVIATVRDYAFAKVKELAQSYKNWTEIELNSLDENHIKQILKDEYEILNPLYLNRIADIAQGNPRLAIMAALLAKQEERLDSINNVSNLYDEYYSSIRKDLQELGDENLLKAAGIVAFFRTVDRSNEKMMEEIETAFGISQEVFWKAVRQLHDHELLDMYENEIVRVSDQVLATYLFYLAFFKEKLLNFAILLNHFFPQLQYRIVDALNPVMSTFDSERIIDVMRPHVNQAWQTYQNAGDEKNLMHFIQVFWFLKQTDILVYIHNCISAMEPELPDLSKLKIEPNSNIPSPSILSTLGLFNHSNENNLQMALELILEYVTKRPTQISQVLYLLTERFGFDHESYCYRFTIQQIVIDILWERVKDGEDIMFSKLFLAVAEHYLYTDFNTTRMKGKGINIFNFTLPPTPELAELRQKIWQRVFQLYQVPILKEDVLNLLYKYSTSGYKVSVVEIIIQDSSKVLPFLESYLDTSSYSHCLIVQSYLDKLEYQKLEISDNDNKTIILMKIMANFWRCLLCETLRDLFTNKTYAMSKVLISDKPERRYLNLEYEEYEQLRQQRIQDFFVNYNLEDYKQFFEQCLEIQEQTDRRNHNTSHLPSQVAAVLINLANRDPQLYADVVQDYISIGNPLRINDFRLINHLIQILDINKTYEILNQSSYYLKRKWLFDFYQLLPQELIIEEHLDQLYSIYKESDVNDIPHDLNFVLKYRALDENLLVKIVEILLANGYENSNKSYPLSCLFHRYEVNTTLLNLLDNQLNLLKQAYLQVLKNDWDIDDNGQYFAYILKRDPEFILEYMDWIYHQEYQSYHFDNGRDYSFLWQCDNYENLMTQIIEYIYQRDEEYLSLGSIRLSKFFILSADGKDNATLWKRQDKILMKLLESRCNEIPFTQLIFDIVTNFSFERRLSFVDFFIRHNQKFDDFKKLRLEPSSWSSSGSGVPVYQNRVEYLESLLPLFNSVPFLQHKQYIEQLIQWLREEIEREKKRDFMHD